MINEFNDQSYTCRKLSEEDVDLYIDYIKKSFGKDASRVLGTNNQRKHALNILKQNDRSIFFLFHGSTVAGKSEIIFKDDGAEFTGLQISSPYIGKKLSYDLHDARKMYLDEINFEGRVYTKIYDVAIASLATAQKNGFVITDEIIEDGDKYYILNLQDRSLKSSHELICTHS